MGSRGVNIRSNCVRNQLYQHQSSKRVSAPNASKQQPEQSLIRQPLRTNPPAARQQRTPNRRSYLPPALLSPRAPVRGHRSLPPPYTEA